MVLREHSLAQALEYARAALALATERGVPPSPENFAVWYEYAVGDNPDLKKAVEILESNGKAFTTEVSRELYERFLGLERQDRTLRSASDRLGSTIREVATLVNDAGAGAKTYGRALVDLTGEVQADASADTLQTTIRRLLIETQSAIQRNTVLEGRLKQSAEQIDQLKQDLDEVRKQASTDPLTGLANRKSFDDRLLGAATEAMETGSEFCLLLCDIDRFKAFNDNHGHQFGDQVLKLVARCLRDGIKGSDLAARYGGEEFAVLLPGCTLENALAIADRLRETIATRRLVRRSTGEDVGAVTMSVGVARFEAGEPITDLIGRADRALYTAKREGRNRVVSQTALEETV